MKMNKQKEWLPHLQHAIPKEAYGFSTSMYSIALEAWRRGLTVRFINKNQIKSHTEFMISNKQKRFRFSGSRGNIISKEAINICADKYQTKELLKEYDVPVVAGEFFDEEATDDTIVEYVEEFDYPVVVKPYNGNSGDGVRVNIQDEQTLRDALVHVRQELGHTRILVERYMDSRDYQFYIIQDRVVAAFERVAAHVIGDGEKTIRQLIKQKNAERKRNPSLHQHLIKRGNDALKQLLAQQEYTLDSIPEEGAHIDLRYKSNIAVGGETVDVTDDLSQKIKKIAVDAAEAISDLPVCAVEVIVDKETGNAYVLELKTQPTISGHLFPANGKARDVAKELIDFYFPETQDTSRDELHYFDFEQVFRIFNSNCVQEYALPRVPKGDMETKRFIINGLVNRKQFIDLVQPQLMALGMNGFFRYRRKGRLVVVLAGNTEALESIMPILEMEETELKKDNFEIIEKKWDKPIQIGFDTIKLRKQAIRKGKLSRKQKKLVSEESSQQTNPLGKIINSIKNINVNM